jgi:hypothetical protein
MSTFTIALGASAPSMALGGLLGGYVVAMLRWARG